MESGRHPGCSKFHTGGHDVTCTILQLGTCTIMSNELRDGRCTILQRDVLCIHICSKFVSFRKITFLEVFGLLVTKLTSILPHGAHHPYHDIPKKCQLLPISIFL